MANSNSITHLVDLEPISQTDIAPQESKWRDIHSYGNSKEWARWLDDSTHLGFYAHDVTRSHSIDLDIILARSFLSWTHVGWLHWLNPIIDNSLFCDRWYDHQHPYLYASQEVFWGMEYFNPPCSNFLYLYILWLYFTILLTGWFTIQLQLCSHGSVFQLQYSSNPARRLPKYVIFLCQVWTN